MDGGDLISIDQGSGVPLYRQIIDQVLLAISTGRLPPGERLPTVRQLAIDARVNPNTVSRAYRELEIRGFVRTRRGMGTYAAVEASAARDESRHREVLEGFCNQVLADAGRLGLALEELVAELRERVTDER